MIRPTRRQIIWAVVGIVVLLLLVLALRPNPDEVETATVVRRDLQVTIETDGRTRITDRFIVAAPVGGRLERIGLTEGSIVGEGAPVARIAPMPLDASAAQGASARLDAATAMRQQAQTRVQQVRAALEQERRDVERQRRLGAAGAIATTQVEQAELALRTREGDLAAATAAVQAATGEVEAARAALLGRNGGGGAAVVVRAPVGGTVLRVPERSGRIVAPGEPLLEIGDPGRLEIVLDVLSTEAVRVSQGARVIVDRWGGELPLMGRVRLVEPAGFTRISALGVEEQRVNVIVDLDEAPPGAAVEGRRSSALGDAYRVEASIVVSELRDVLAVPASAVFGAGEQTAVFIVDDGVARERAVALGARSGATVQVTSGLEGGETVILFPSDRIRDGIRVKGRTSVARGT